MTRAFIEEALLFVLPFALFALVLVVRKRTPLARVHWDGKVSWLTLAGLALACGWLVYTALVTEHRVGSYVPAHMENGKLVPGRVD